MGERLDSVKSWATLMKTEQMAPPEPVTLWEDMIYSIRASALPAYLCDLEGTICWASSSFYQLAGVDEMHTSSWSILRLLAPESLSDALYNLRRSTTGEVHGFSLRCAGPTEDRFEVFTFTFPVRLANGHCGFGGIVFPQNSPERTKVWRNLLHQHTAKGKANAIAFTDREGVLLGANTTYYGATAVTQDTALSRLAPHLEKNPRVCRRLQHIDPHCTRWQGELQLEKDSRRYPWLLQVRFLKSMLPSGVLCMHWMIEKEAGHPLHEQMDSYLCRA